MQHTVILKTFSIMKQKQV